MKADKKSLVSGILAGILPHSFCILFVILSILGATAAASFLRPLFLSANLFYFLILISFCFATVSAIFYLKRNGILSAKGAKKKWRYLTILYGTTILINLVLFIWVFPTMANLGNQKIPDQAVISQGLVKLTIKVAIPCTGHAGLITGDLRKINGVENVEFRQPQFFDIIINSSKVSKEKILALEIFKTYSVQVIE